MLLFAFGLDVGAQSIQEMDARMAYYMDRLNHWYIHADETMGGADSLENNNDLFIEYLEKRVIQLDTALCMPFPAAKKNGLHVTGSSDNIMRIYSWDRRDDPDKEHIENIAAFMTYYNVRYIDLATLDRKGAPCYFFDSIYPFKCKEGNVYLATFYRNNPARVEGIKAYGIVDHKLARIPFFKDDSGTFSEMTYDYSPDASPEAVLIHFNEKGDKIYLPRIKDGTFTGKYMVYVFDGNKFAYDKNAR